MNAPKKQRADVHGWIALDKPLGMTSTHAVAVVRRLLNAKKAGHAGTLDPLASGLLPLAFGEATKTVPYVVDGEKAYRFTVTFGVETDTDDAEDVLFHKVRHVRRSSRYLPPCRNLRARSHKCHRVIQPSKLMANAPMIWRAAAKRLSCSRALLKFIR